MNRVTTFQGFSVEALDFYDDLEQQNTREFWADHKATYQSQVREPMAALMTALAPEFGEGTIFRPHRDVRFSKDKSPYKTHQGAFVAVAPGTGYYAHLDAAGLRVGGGFHHHSPGQVERYRLAVDTETTGRRLVDILTRLTGADYEIGGDRLKTRPRGFDPEHPRIDLLRHKSLTAGRFFGTPDWLHSAAALEQVATAWRDFVPLVEWIDHNVGAPD